MPWKFILFVVICILFSVFIGLNLPYTATIDFLFAKVEGAPVFLVILFSFFAGSGVGLLASIFKKSKKRKQEKLSKKKGKEVLPDDGTGQPEPAAERGHGRKRK
jgi:uncharacterized integral membrane protein